MTYEIRNLPDSLIITIEFELKNFYNLKIKADHQNFNKEKHFMSDNYEKIVQDNLKKLYDPLPPDLDQRLGATREENRFLFDAFGQPCTIGPGRSHLSVFQQRGPIHAHGRPGGCRGIHLEKNHRTGHLIP